ncbi:DUF1214 domain-containing protein [Falsiruegeria mediterranea]|uniref:DUF1214 domain-containing protein n=1 Tax=Falsiruegeria mediterranea M17 TaxID=1200281 RepID=A0A2R8CG66_9RHOB|nr:DUF1214 domain-containing protein [Falsiruegeria mediterranea]SPJ31443.1 hypothetical protein TRM7615_04986 [Falsiruegeria mediterranea M17]
MIVGGPEREANWLNLAPDATHMMFRQYIADDRVQKLYDITVERIDEPESLPTAAEMQEELAEKLTNASGFIRHMAEPYIKISRGTLARPNEMLPLSPEARGALGANSANAYWLGSWDLDETEALLIEFTPVPAEYWSLVAHNTWIQALPQTQMQMQLNMLEASRDEDGKVRFVVSHSDPGYANWLSTGDLRRGFLALRVTNKQGEENVAAHKVTLDELAAEMPDNSPMVSSDERRLAVETKRRQILTRYGR